MEKKRLIYGTIFAIALVVLIASCNQSTGTLKFEKTIATRAGEIKLKYESGIATLSGTLSRSTPCVDWKIVVSGTDDIPPSRVIFDIFNANKGVICIQVLGEPQAINATAAASEETHYTVKLEDEVVFSGRLH